MYHKDLEAWKKSIELVSDVYKITEKFPDIERYGLANQIRRCAVSIPSNLAEGAARSSQKETIRFIDISIGSLAELETQLIIAQNLGYISEDSNLLNKIKQVNALFIGVQKYLTNSKTQES